MAQNPEHVSLQSALLGVVVRALSFEPRDDSTRRAAMRAICAAIEGILWILQCELMSIASHELSTSQRAILRDEPHILRTGGKVGRVPSKVTLKQRVQFAAAVVAGLRPECKIDFDEAGWQNLLATLEVQDRLGHPESLADLDITDLELEAGDSGAIWFLDNIAAVVQTELGHPRMGEPSMPSRLGAPRVRRPRALPMASGGSSRTANRVMMTDPFDDR